MSIEFKAMENFGILFQVKTTKNYTSRNNRLYGIYLFQFAEITGYMEFTCLNLRKFSRTSVAQTLVVRKPRLFQTR